MANKKKIFEDKETQSGFRFGVNCPGGLLSVQNKVTKDFFVINQKDLKLLKKAIEYALVSDGGQKDGE